MCGIAGFRSSDADIEPDRLRRIVEAMTTALRHRGPDDSDYWIDPDAGLALGHRRLSIIDLSAAGRQPMTSACGRYVITYNGEIYNFPALRAELEQLGHQFRGHSDTEVMLDAIARWGVIETLGRLNGMFAFALWDKRERSLTLARDRAGKKPLYYGWCGDSFMFGSELKALCAHPSFDPAIDRDALGLFIQYSWMPAPHSIYSRIRQLPAGTVLTVTGDSEPGQSEPHPYWSAQEIATAGSRAPTSMSREEATEALEEVLRQAVARRMIADVSLGAFLSGGIDSSVVVALMRTVSDQPVKTFSIGFHEAKYNEAEHARAIAQHLETDHTDLYVTPDDCLGVIPKLATMYDEPFGDYSQIPTYLVSRLARQSVTVALSGDGGDELFGGYSDYAKNLEHWQRQMSVWRRYPPWMRRQMAGVMTDLGRAGQRALGMGDFTESVGPVRAKIAKRLRKLEKRGRRILPFDTGAEMHARLRARVDPASQLVLGAEPADCGMTDAGRWAGVDDPLLGMMLVDFTNYMADDILTKVDRASMAVSLEVRCPLLDPKVIEFAWSLPDEMRMGPSGGKQILRDVLARHVPRDLFERPKQGFNVPLEEWLRGPLRDWAEALLDESRLRQEGYFRANEIRSMWRKHLSGEQPRTFVVWSVLMFQAWHETWINRDHSVSIEAAA
ncbi:MAG: asparagine synthase (glutamine-hydrolyzing) [Pseudomonadota bacterium]